MSDASAPWGVVRARLRRLPGDARAVFALAVAERLVKHSQLVEHEALLAALEVGWQATLNDDGPWQTVREELERRPDVDDDEVAAACFALGAVGGSPEDAEMATQRCLDAAYDRIPYAEDARAFRPLTVDTAHHAVQDEILWQESALHLLEESGVSPQVVSRLRA